MSNIEQSRPEANNEELANAACITTFTASRLLSRWQRSGVILKKRGKVVISSPERLLSERPVKHEKTASTRPLGGRLRSGNDA